MNNSTCSSHSNSSCNNSGTICSCACHKKCPNCRQQQGELMPSTASNRSRHNNSTPDAPKTGTILVTVGAAVATTSSSAAAPSAPRSVMSPRDANALVQPAAAVHLASTIPPVATAKCRTASSAATPASTSSSRTAVTLPPRKASNASSARNLIAEAIKDVSETIKYDTGSSVLPRTDGGGASAGDFPTSISVVGTATSRGCNRNRSTAISADAGKTATPATRAATAGAARTTATTAGTTTAKGEPPVSQLTKMKKITRETTSTTTNTARATATVATTTAKAQKMPEPESAATRTQSRVTTTAVAAAQAAAAATAAAQKSKSTENKCPLEALTNVSSQGKVEATISQSQAHNGSTTAHRNKWIIAQCEHSAQHDRLPTGSRAASATRDIKRISISLAERKAKLKADFFGDTASQAGPAATSVTERSPAGADDVKIVAKVKGSRKADALKRFLFRTQSSQRGRPLRCDKVGSTTRTDFSTYSSTVIAVVPVTVLPPVTVNVFAAEPKPEPEPVSLPSLVAQRKLDLKRKFEQQSNSAKTSPAQRCTHLNSSSRVERLVQKFDIKPHRKMIVNTNKVHDTDELSLKPDPMEQRNSPLSDEGCNLGQSPYSSDNEDNESIRTTSTTVERCKHKDKVARSASSDSALGLDVDDSMDAAPAQPPTGSTQRRMTLTVTDLPLRPALLPLAEPTALPDSPTVEVHNTLTQTAVPSKVLLQERVVELPEDPRSVGCSLSSSRRESAQSCGSDYTTAECPGGRRFVRTPSVVVSDYSDDVMCGITLEEIEYFRAQRMRRRYSSLDTANEADGQSDVSASSSCSNLYYCGSTISALDGAECYVNGVRTALDRKTSDCSTGSASADEDGFTIPENSGQMSTDLADLLAAQHLSSKQPKKVGLVVPRYGATGEKTQF